MLEAKFGGDPLHLSRITPEMHLGLCQSPMMELIRKTLNGF